MTTNLIRFEKMTRELIDKQDELIKSSCPLCDFCRDHTALMRRANLQATQLLRGLVVYIEKIKEDRREKRRRHRENVKLRQNDF